MPYDPRGPNNCRCCRSVKHDPGNMHSSYVMLNNWWVHYKWQSETPVIWLIEKKYVTRTGAVSATANLLCHSGLMCWAAQQLQCCESYRGSVPSVSAPGHGHWRRPGLGQCQHQTHWWKYMTLVGSWVDARNPTDHVAGSRLRSSQWNVSSQQGTGSADITHLQH